MECWCGIMIELSTIILHKFTMMYHLHVWIYPFKCAIVQLNLWFNYAQIFLSNWCIHIRTNLNIWQIKGFLQIEMILKSKLRKRIMWRCYFFAIMVQLKDLEMLTDWVPNSAAMSACYAPVSVSLANLAACYAPMRVI